MLALPALSFGQWTENFDSNTNLPAGWAVINNGDLNGWEIGTPSGAAQSGANVAKIRFGSTAHDDYLITKAITVQTGVSDNISFYVRSRSTVFLENYKVLLSTTDQTSAAFNTVLQPEEKAPGTWTKKSFDLSAYVGQTVYVAIHATDTNQWELYADTFVVGSNSTLATAEITNAKDIVGVYPNPFTEVLNVSKADKIQSVSVTDLSGKLIKTLERPSSALQLEDLKQGVYMLDIKMKDGSKQTTKIIKK